MWPFLIEAIPAGWSADCALYAGDCLFTKGVVMITPALDSAIAIAKPIEPAWVDCKLSGLAERAQAGEPDGPLRDELLAEIWPWVTRTTEALVRTLPAGSDKAAVRSEVIWESYQAVRRIEWSRYRTWPALLRARVRGGYSYAARAEDVLTRGQRKARSAYLTEVEKLTQQLARTLTPAESRKLAQSVSPHRRIAPVLLGRSMMVSLEEAGIDQESKDEDPGAILERTWMAQAVREWVDKDLPAELAQRVREVLHADHEIPVRLRAALTPFTSLLRLRLAM